MSISKKIKTLSLLLILMGTCCLGQSNAKLETGWYCISDQETNFKRNINESSQAYYLLPEKILGLENLQNQVRVDSFSLENKIMLEILLQCDSIGTKKWEASTIKYLNKMLGFILNNQLICVMKVVYPVHGGQLSIWHETYTKSDLENIMMTIKAEMN